MHFKQDHFGATMGNYLMKRGYRFRRKKRYKPVHSKLWRVILIKKRRRVLPKNKRAEQNRVEEVNSQRGSKINSRVLFYILISCSIIHNTQAVNTGLQLAPLMQDNAIIPSLHAAVVLFWLPWSFAHPPATREGQRGMGFVISEINSHDPSNDPVSY